MPLKLVLTTVGTTGDVRPFVALALRLRAAGHTVRVCSYDLYRPWFAGHGLDFVTLGAPVTEHQIRDTARRAAAARSPFRQVEILQEFHLQTAAAHYTDCRAATSGFDLAVCHTIHSLGQAAVLDNDLPWIGARFEPSLVPTAYAPPQGMPDLGRRLNPLLWRLVERGMARIDRVLDEQLARIGSQQRGLPMFRALSPLLNLVACSPSIAAVYPDRPATVRFTGAWTVDEPAAELPEALESFLQAGPPPVVVSFGSMAGGDPQTLGRILLEAVAGSGRRAVIQRGTAQLAPGDAGAEILLVDYVPHSALFPRAACVVHHGGAGTTHAACAAGVPSVVVPHVGDQPYWAVRLHDLGVAGAPLPLARLTSRRLAERIDRCLASDTMRRRAGGLAARIRSEHGLATACRLIEAVATEEEERAR